MTDTYYVLAKVIWCGECDDFAIEKILRFKYNVPFASKEIYHYINLDYVLDDWDKGIKEYAEGGQLFYYVYDVDDDFDPHYDSLIDALALYVVYRYQQNDAAAATDEDGKQLFTFDAYGGKEDGVTNILWHITWHKYYSQNEIDHLYITAPTAEEARRKWEREYGGKGYIYTIEGGPY